MKKLSFIFFVFVFLVSCRSTKEFSTEKIQISKTISDTIFIERQPKNSDTIFIEVQKIVTGNKNCDSLCLKQTQILLKNLNINRKTEKGQTKIYFDQYKNQLVLYNELKEQLNIYKATNSQNIQTKIVEKTKEIPKPFIPKIVQCFAILGGVFFLLVCAGIGGWLYAKYKSLI